MFERFTAETRQVVVRSQEEAWIAEADAIGTEYLLLGLLEVGDELVAEALKGAGVPERAPRASRPSLPLPRVHSPFTPEAKRAFDRSLEEAAALGERWVRPGHVLLALLREDDASPSGGGAAITMLQEQGVDVDWLRNRVTELLAK